MKKVGAPLKDFITEGKGDDKNNSHKFSIAAVGQKEFQNKLCANNRLLLTQVFACIRRARDGENFNKEALATVISSIKEMGMVNTFERQPDIRQEEGGKMRWTG